MVLTSNIGTVLARFQKAAQSWERRVWRAFVREVDFAESAQATLAALLLPTERQWLPVFLDGLTQVLKDSVLELRLKFDQGESAARLDADQASAERAVQAWVNAPVVGDGSPDESGKRIELEDIAAAVQAGFTPEEAAARRVLSILGFGRPLWGPEDHYRGQAGLNEGDLTREEAAESLRQRIQRFLAATGGGALTPARVRELLRAVLAGWVALTKLRLPEIARREFRHAYGR
jgi:hypothetical protein